MSTATTPRAEPATLVGQTIGGRYRVERLLGEGGMGAVYEAEHTLMHKRVAVKVLHAEMSQMSEVGGMVAGTVHAGDELIAEAKKAAIP